jgi:hypothetical protein
MEYSSYIYIREDCQLAANEKLEVEKGISMVDDAKVTRA